MVVVMVLLTIVVFVVVDVLSRIGLQRYREAKLRKAREQALDVGLRLDFTDEAKSLKRVEVDAPKARILAVDDEPIVLDSFRKILVVAGYAVDTVETGPEALGLIQRHDYDFVFTDLKMPDMDGVEVVKAVKHLRPDIDVIVVTGYATIESAVETMKHGAMDYVQKPFTADELVAFVGASLLRRQDRIERQMRPQVHLVTPSQSALTAKHAVNVPSGVFISPAHTWVSVSLNGMLAVGLDDFAEKILEGIDAVELPPAGKIVAQGSPLFSVRHGAYRITFPSPVSGRVTAVNRQAQERPDVIRLKPYESGWLCTIEPTNLPGDLQSLRIGADAAGWYQEEIDKYMAAMQAAGGDGSTEPKAEDTRWEAFSRAFLRP